MFTKIVVKLLMNLILETGTVALTRIAQGAGQGLDHQDSRLNWIQKSWSGQYQPRMLSQASVVTGTRFEIDATSTGTSI